ncbi:MAG: integrase core domain-containing protein [Candidatus Binatia bacterium]
MPYREVTMFEVKEVVRLWLAGIAKKQIAARLGLDPKTVRRYVKAAAAAGIDSAASLTDARLVVLMSELHASPGRTHGDTWALCESQRGFIEPLLKQRVRLSKIRRLLERHGVRVPYPTLHRYAVAELGFGRTAATIPVADCGPGEELQVDTGWMTLLEPEETGKRRRIRAWIFTAVLSRYRFVYPCFQETTASAIEACEAAWAFYGGVFRTLLPDNTRVIVDQADALEPRINRAFLEYAQARGFHIDPTRVRHPRDKARVERAVATVRDDCFAGETLRDLDRAREHAHHWCEHEYGMRRHSSTARLPREHFLAVERATLLPAPTLPYDLPLWAEPKVARDQFAQVARALYSLPTRWVGKTLRARADSVTVRFYHGAELIKTHARQHPGGRATDQNDFPEEKSAYARRDVAFLERQAARHGETVGRFAHALLEGPLPWTRMRRVYALIGLAKRYGDTRVEAVCGTALAADMLDVRRLERMLKQAMPPAPPARSGRVLPIARFLRTPEQYALPLSTTTPEGDER